MHRRTYSEVDIMFFAAALSVAETIAAGQRALISVSKRKASSVFRWAMPMETLPVSKGMRGDPAGYAI